MHTWNMEANKGMDVDKDSEHKVYSSPRTRRENKL